LTRGRVPDRPRDGKNRLLPITRPVYDPVAPGKPNAADINPAEFPQTVT
jgi:hypothetical protein